MGPSQVQSIPGNENVQIAGQMGTAAVATNCAVN